MDIEPLPTANLEEDNLAEEGDEDEDDLGAIKAARSDRCKLVSSHILVYIFNERFTCNYFRSYSSERI